MATVQDTLAQRKTESAGKIGDLYNKQYDAQAATLKTTYDQNVSNAQAEQAKIAPQYQTQANTLATAYERNRRNLNLQNMGNGMGTGTAVQQQEALNRGFQQNYAGLRGQEATAQAQAGQNLVNLGTEYRNQLNAARADAENKKASALVTDMNTQNEWYDNQAKIMAGLGNFSGYEQLYGKDAADQMKLVWIIQNPEAALGAGLIDAGRYKELTGRDAGTGPAK